MNQAVVGVVERLVPKVVLRVKSSDKPWFDGQCRTAFDVKQTAYHAWARSKTPPRWEAYLRARNEAQVVYAEARERHDRRLRDALNSSSSSHKWWVALKGAVFGARPALPGLRWCPCC